MRISRVNLSRHLFSIIIAIALSSIISFYYSMTHEFLIPATAIIVMLTSVGNVIYQGVKRFLFVATLVAGYSAVFSTPAMLYLRLGDVCLGAMLGILVNWLVFPRRPDLEFRAAILPLLNVYGDYLLAIVELLVKKTDTEIEKLKINIEFQLQELPLWVYERGFDSGLKTGHQYFLMKVFQIAELLFSMHNVARNSFDKSILKKVREPLLECAQLGKNFFKALETVLELKKLQSGVEDFDVQLIKLERKFNASVPPNLELLDMPNEIVNFYEFIYALKDLRDALIKLGQTLR